MMFYIYYLQSSYNSIFGENIIGVSKIRKIKTPSLREFKKTLPFLLTDFDKTCLNAYIINTQIFNLIKYDLKAQ